MILLHAGTGRHQLADEDIFLQTDQRVHLGMDGRFGQHAGGPLEGGRGQEGICCQGILSKTGKVT